MNNAPINDTRPPVSAYIRAFNEERKIGEVVRGAFLVAREVIVIDSGSTDRTKEIAATAGAKILEQEWVGWGKQKRVAEEACTYDWLLDLDGDEVVTPEFAKEANALFANGEPAFKVYKTFLALAMPTGDVWQDFGHQTRHKIYDRRVARMPNHDGWDQFRVPEGIEVGVVNTPMLHYAFTDIAHLMSKLNRNSSIPAPMKSRSTLASRILFGLPFYFAKRYFMQQYIRGGVYGFALALMYGYARWLRDVKMWEQSSAGFSQDNNP